MHSGEFSHVFFLLNASQTFYFTKINFFVCPRSSQSEVGLPLQDSTFEVTDVQRRKSKHFTHLPVASASAVGQCLHSKGN